MIQIGTLVRVTFNDNYWRGRMGAVVGHDRYDSNYNRVLTSAHSDWVVFDDRHLEVI